MPSPYSIPDSAIRVGKRVFIRPIKPSDKIEFVEKIVLSKKFHRPWIFYQTRPSFFRSYMTRFEQNSEGHVICSNANGALLGVININDIVGGAFQSGYLGFYAFIDSAGKGYMSEGMRLLLEYAFVDLGLHRLEANIQPRNHPSKLFIKRHGFINEGFSPRYLKIGGKWRDHERWALLRESWEQQQEKIRAQLG